MPIPYPRIPPDIVRIGPFRLRWYGVMYIVGYIVGIIAYGLVRSGIEFTPQPDAQLGFVLGPFSIMVVVGAVLLLNSARRP